MEFHRFFILTDLLGLFSDEIDSIVTGWLWLYREKLYFNSSQIITTTTAAPLKVIVDFLSTFPFDFLFFLLSQIIDMLLFL